jgi:small subunit ribosomal protein S16
MVVIRLSRAGAKKRPFYYIRVTDSRNPRDGKCIEPIGYFNPLSTGKDRLSLDLTKLAYWQQVGAQVSDRVKSLIHEFKKTQVVAEAGE